jgi:hypothetical protein
VQQQVCLACASAPTVSVSCALLPLLPAARLCKRPFQPCPQAKDLGAKMREASSTVASLNRNLGDREKQVSRHQCWSTPVHWCRACRLARRLHLLRATAQHCHSWGCQASKWRPS